MFKSGFVTIIGRPNVGKSTLINSIMNNHLSITSPIAQTTRNAIKAIFTKDDCQIVFIDTPGIHKPKNDLGEYMNKQSLGSLNDADCIIWLIDANMEFGGGDLYVSRLLRDVNVPVYLVINKIDLINDKVKYFENKTMFLESLSFNEVIEISATLGTGIDELLNKLKNTLPEGPKYYDDGVLSDQLERFIISELIREKVFLLTKDEIPHSIAVDIDDMKVDKNSCNVLSTIYVDRDSQKKIIIGSNGSMIKKIGTLARKDIEEFIDKKVYLELWVKVDKDWRNKQTSLKRLGYK